MVNVKKHECWKSKQIQQTNPKVYLGIEIERKPDGIHISQTNYARQVLEKYNMQDSREMKTPMTAIPPTSDKEKDEIKFPYREAVGSLLYMTSKTRPDIRCKREKSHLGKS
jgi:hypothetical protein